LHPQKIKPWPPTVEAAAAAALIEVGVPGRIPSKPGISDAGMGTYIDKRYAEIR